MYMYIFSKKQLRLDHVSNICMDTATITIHLTMTFPLTITIHLTITFPLTLYVYIPLTMTFPLTITIHLTITIPLTIYVYSSSYTVPKAILWKEMFICTVRNVYQVLKKCFFTANHLAEKENFVLYIRNVCHTVFLSLQRNFSLPSSPLSFRAKSLLLSLFC